MTSSNISRRSFVRTIGLGGLAAATAIGMRSIPALAVDEDAMPAMRNRLHGEQFMVQWLDLLGGDADDLHTAWTQLTYATQQGRYLGDEERFLAAVQRSSIIRWDKDDADVASRAFNDPEHIHVALYHKNTFGFGGLFRSEFLLKQDADGSLMIDGWNDLDPVAFAAN